MFGGGYDAVLFSCVRQSSTRHAAESGWIWKVATATRCLSVTRCVELHCHPGSVVLGNWDRLLMEVSQGMDIMGDIFPVERVKKVKTKPPSLAKMLLVCVEGLIY